jgi:hypothetical protein
MGLLQSGTVVYQINVSFGFFPDTRPSDMEFHVGVSGWFSVGEATLSATENAFF